MDFYILFLLLCLFQAPLPSSSTSDTLTQGSFLSVEKASTTDVLVSANGVFSAGFFPVGINAFCFALWFTMPSNNNNNKTIVWMANRDQPVNERGSKLRLTKNGNVVLLDAGKVAIWSTGTTSFAAVKLQLHDTGNLVLREVSEVDKVITKWESFQSPTDTLLPQQYLSKDANLVSSKSKTNYSSGFYYLSFDNSNVLRLSYRGPDPLLSSFYWPPTWQLPKEAGRTILKPFKTAVLDSKGRFYSSDDLVFLAADQGAHVQRRLTLDPDGNLRLYSLDARNKNWVVTWESFTEPCRIHGICGPNSFCSYHHASGRSCSCVPGYKRANYSDWSYGCQSDFQMNFTQEETGFLRVANDEFYGYDSGYFESLTLKQCEEECLKSPVCKAFQYKYMITDGGTLVYQCYPKELLFNGQRTSSFEGDVYIRLPKAINISSYDQEKPQREINLDCSSHKLVKLVKKYGKGGHEDGLLKILLWVAVALGGVEFVSVSVVLCFLYLSRKEKTGARDHHMLLFSATRFKEFTYAELRKATLGFREEIGSGGGGTVYKGVLSDGRVAAIKRLKEANRGEAGFLAEVGSIGRLNHMNLIDMWGYCAEGKHWLLVYEYMEHGSLADNIRNLEGFVLDWEKRFAIAIGTAKGLAYLHEECLEWVLHCDVKPQNILLDSNYNPKVADFGLSKLQNRGESHNSSFSMIRGTRGYMAPEWVYNLTITSKVDVYSYGIVALELVTGRRPTVDGGRTLEHGRLVTWVREKMNIMESWIEEIADPIIELGEFDNVKMELLVKVALQCVEEDKESRPTMRQVVEMLQLHEDESAMPLAS